MLQHQQPRHTLSDWGLSIRPPKKKKKKKKGSSVATVGALIHQCSSYSQLPSVFPSTCRLLWAVALGYDEWFSIGTEKRKGDPEAALDSGC
jgi:hypothetical protein